MTRLAVYQYVPHVKRYFGILARSDGNGPDLFPFPPRVSKLQLILPIQAGGVSILPHRDGEFKTGIRSWFISDLFVVGPQPSGTGKCRGALQPPHHRADPRRSLFFLELGHNNCLTFHKRQFCRIRRSAAAIFVEKVLTSPSGGVRLPADIRERRDARQANKLR